MRLDIVIYTIKLLSGQVTFTWCGCKARPNSLLRMGVHYHQLFIEIQRENTSCIFELVSIHRATCYDQPVLILVVPLYRKRPNFASSVRLFFNASRANQKIVPSMFHEHSPPLALDHCFSFSFFIFNLSPELSLLQHLHLLPPFHVLHQDLSVLPQVHLIKQIELQRESKYWTFEYLTHPNTRQFVSHIQMCTEGSERG